MTLLLSFLLSCTTPEPTYEPPPIFPGAPVAGAAEAWLEMPIGVPLGCYTARCKCLGSTSYQDKRQGPYNTGFDESTGIHTRPSIKVIWLENGDDQLVLIKTDLCMSNDKVLAEITRQLEAATGLDLTGKVTLTVNHTHSGPGAYNDSWHWVLGVDRYNEEIFRRMATQLADVALAARAEKVPAKIGLGWAKDWDPDNRIYSDRRGSNNELQVWDDAPPGMGKDPYLAVLRVETVEGEPIALAFNYAMHGIVMDADNPMQSSDSGGGVEARVAEAFDEPVVVMFLQGSGGDASPRGSDRDFARIETLGELATPAILDLWGRTKTSAEPIRMETASRHIWQHHSQIRVTRQGTVDWYYTPLTDEPNPDNVIYDEHGDIISPIDEYNAPYGAAFCGSDVPLFPVGDIGTFVYPYKTCTDVELVSRVVLAAGKFEEEELVLPFPETMKAGTTATRIGPIPTLLPDGTEVVDDLFAGFFPGEPTAMFGEQWRRRVRDELGFEQALIVGYSQDHEGYFLIPEDWLTGGYEPNIAIWGPLQGEHVMEGVLSYGESVLATNEVREDPDPTGYYRPTDYAQHPLPTLTPDPTPDAGTRLAAAPEYFWTPRDMTVDLVIPARVPRVQGLVQMAWLGGDPMVDPPHVFLEREVEGSWERVTTHAGRPVNEAMTDILVAYTPDPLYPVDALQKHQYFAAWQAVAHALDRAGMPLGTYRLKVEGLKYVGDSETWPWATEPYEVASEPFELVPGTISLAPAEGGISAWYDAPENAWRLIDLEGDSEGTNPVRGTLKVEVHTSEGAVRTSELEGTVADKRTSIPVDLADAVRVVVTDGFGNQGELSLAGE